MSGAWLRQHLRDLASDWSRTLLVVLGVVWGTLSLTVVLSFGEGFHRAMTRAMRASGGDLIIIWSGATTRPYKGLPPGRWIGLRPEDAHVLRENVPAVGEVCLEYVTSGVPVESSTRRTNARVHGVSPSFGELRCLIPEPGGRFLNERDEDERRRVAFLGTDVKKRLHGSTPAVGGTVRIWGVPFTVVGIMRKKMPLGSYEGFDREKIFIPASTFRTLRGWRYVSVLVVQARSPDRDAEALQGIYETLGPRWGFDPDDRAALSPLNRIASNRDARAIIAGIRILMGIIGGLGLLVALVGVANVTYVLVEERRREIGIQMALGARPAWLLAGVLVEALALTAAGGLLGVVASAVILRIYALLPLGEAPRAYLGEATLSVATALVVTVLLAAAGCVAGYVPARRAARLDPVEALHEE